MKNISGVFFSILDIWKRHEFLKKTMNSAWKQKFLILKYEVSISESFSSGLIHSSKRWTNQFSFVLFLMEILKYLRMGWINSCLRVSVSIMDMRIFIMVFWLVCSSILISIWLNPTVKVIQVETIFSSVKWGIHKDYEIWDCFLKKVL